MVKKNNLEKLPQSPLFGCADEKENLIKETSNFETVHNCDEQIIDKLVESNEFNLSEPNDLAKTKDITTNDDTGDEPISNIVKVNEYVVYLRKS